MRRRHTGRSCSVAGLGVHFRYFPAKPCPVRQRPWKVLHCGSRVRTFRPWEKPQRPPSQLTRQIMESVRTSEMTFRSLFINPILLCFEIVSPTLPISKTKREGFAANRTFLYADTSSFHCKCVAGSARTGLFPAKRPSFFAGFLNVFLFWPPFSKEISLKYPIQAGSDMCWSSPPFTKMHKSRIKWDSFTAYSFIGLNI